MATRVTFSRGTVGPSLKGRFYHYERDGIEIVSTWPRKRPGPGTENQERAKAMFAECCLAMKMMNAKFIEYARKDAEGKPMLPRDALMAALYGRGPTICFPSGRVVRPMATRLDMSMLMDNIAWEPYSLLYRDDETWIGLNAPSTSSFLAFDPSQGYLWVDAQDVASTGKWQLHNRAVVNNINQNAKGNIYQPFLDFSLTGLTVSGSWNNEAGIYVGIYDLVPGTDQIASKIWEDELYLLAGAGIKTWVIPVPDVILQSGTRYWIAVRTSTAGGTANTVICTAAPECGVLPIIPDPARYQLSQAVPAPGHNLTFGSTANVFAIGLRS